MCVCRDIFFHRDDIELVAHENGRVELCLQDLSSTSSDLLGLFQQFKVESGSCHSNDEVNNGKSAGSWQTIEFRQIFFLFK